MEIATGYDDCIIGVIRTKGRPDVVCYDYDRCVLKLIERGLSHQEAVEMVEFNVVDAYVGDGTPAFLSRPAMGQDPIDFVNHWEDGL